MPGDDLEFVSLWFFATSKPVRIKTSHHLTGKSKIMDHLLDLANLHPIEVLSLKVHYPSLDKKGLNPVHTCNENAKASVNKDAK